MCSRWYSAHWLYCGVGIIRDTFYTHGHARCDVFFSVSVFSDIKLRCDGRFKMRFQSITLVLVNQRNYFENAIACSKRMLKTTVATQL